MERRIISERIFFLLLSIVLLFGLGQNASATGVKSSENQKIEDAKEEKKEEDYRIEQVQVFLPFVTAYCYLGDEEKSLKAQMQDENLIYDKETEVGAIHYYVLIDQSYSCDSGYMEKMKASLKILKKKMKDEDTLTVISISDDKSVEYEPLIDAAKSKEDEQFEKIDRLQQKDQNTYLYETIRMTAENVAEMKREQNERNVMLVISDCIDDSQGEGQGEKSAIDALVKSGMPLYVLALKNSMGGHESLEKNNTGITDFDSLAKTYGGRIERVAAPDEMESCMESLLNSIQKVKAYTFYADTEITNKEDIFKIEWKIGDEEFEQERDVIPDTYDKDYKGKNNKPSVTLNKTEEDSISVVFDKPVENAGNKNNYKIQYQPAEGEEEEDYQVNSVTTKETKSDTPWTEQTEIILKLNKKLYNGTYTIQFNDGKGAIETIYGEPQLPVKQSIEIKDQKHPSKILEWLKKFGWIILVFVVLIVIIVIIYRRIKKKGGVVYVENEAVLVDNVVQKQHVQVEKKESLFIKLIISGGGKESVEISSELNGSLIVGRSDLSDIFIDDAMMSRQHFVITDEEGVLYIQDLETTNGTMVNGVRLKGKQPISPNDVISAGSLQIRIYW